MLIYYRFSDNSVLKITFSVQINCFMPVKLCYIWHFFVDSPKEIETKYVFLQQKAEFTLLLCHVDCYV